MGCLQAHQHLLDEAWLLNRNGCIGGGARRAVCRRSAQTPATRKSTVPDDWLRAKGPGQVWALDFKFGVIDDVAG
jgi:hypothetical protein